MLPESPRWLLLTGRGEAQAEEALRRSLGAAAAGPEGASLVRAQMQAMQDSLQAAAAGPGAASKAKSGSGEGAGSGSWQVLQPRYRWPLLVGMSLMLFQQVGAMQAEVQ